MAAVSFPAMPLAPTPSEFSHKKCPSSQSRSTSEGDTSSCGDDSEYFGLETDYQYPATFVVRNGFIDQDTSMKNVLAERGARSCPASKIATLGGLGNSAAEILARMDTLPVDHDGIETVDPPLYEGKVTFKNTFVHFPERPASLEDFIEERQAQSCPASAVVPVAAAEVCASYVEPRADSNEASELDGQEVNSTFLATPFGSFDDSTASFSKMAVAPVLFDDMPVIPSTPFGSFHDMEPEQINVSTLSALMCAQPDVMWGGEMPPLEPIVNPKMVLSLAETLPQAVPGSEELPSVGSADHWIGTCKPCAFTHKGCSSGVNCPFCHLCDPGEKKRRRKEKVSYLRSLRRWKRENGLQ